MSGVYKMSGGQFWGFDSIGAIATKKPFGSAAVQATFPSVFSQAFAQMGSPQAYLPTRGMPHAPLERGDGFQSAYHEQKRREADYMAHAKVHSTRMMNTRAFSSHNGYFGLPQPVLGQRKFANESNGALSATSARQDYGDAPFHYTEPHAYSHHRAHGGGLSGGVLRTAQGQGYAKARLMDRIAQINAINSNQGNFTPDPRGSISTPNEQTESMTQIRQSEASNVGTQAKTELYLLLQNLNDSLVGDETIEGGEADVTRFTYQDTTRALGLLFRLAPTLEPYDLADILDLVNGIQIKLMATIEDEDAVAASKYETALSLLTLMDKTQQYLTEFIRQTTEFGTRTDQEKVQISKTLVQTLGFAKSMRADRSQLEDTMKASRDEFYDNESGPMTGEHGSTSRTSGAGRRVDMDPLIRYATKDARSSARFSTLAPTRESQIALQVQRQSGLGTFDVDERGDFGNNAGHFYPTGGREVGYADGGIDGPPEQPINQRDHAGPEIARISTDAGAPTIHEGPPDVRGVYDKDTQAFNVATRGKGKASVNLPTTREGFVELAKKINAMPESERPTKDGKKIQVYASSSLASLRKNFRRRLC